MSTCLLAKLRIIHVFISPRSTRTATGKIQRRHVRDKFVQEEAKKSKGKQRQAKL